MRPRRASVVALVLAATAGTTACGGSGAPRAPDLSALPLVPRAHVVTRVTACDTGKNAYCAIELVVQAAGYRTSDDLLLSERRALHARGWTGAKGDTTPESAADSPGHRLRVTYATAAGELDGIDQGWITRERQVTLALSRAIFDGRPTIALMLERGSV
jgi:hypothetical protein